MINELCSGMQLGTQGYNRRPYGVGLLVAGFDDKGPHIYQVAIISMLK
jgi:20S proteasome subunit alpha 6